MALWNKNGYSQGPEGENEEFDLILGDEDFEDEEFAEEESAEEGFAAEEFSEEEFSEEDAEEDSLDGLLIYEDFAEAPEEDERAGAFRLRLTKNRAAVGSAFLALLIFVVAAVAVVTGRGSESVNAFSTVSSSLEDVDVIGGEGLAGLMTSKDTEYQATLLSAAEEETVSKDYEETEDTEDLIAVSLVMTSVEKDLKIKFTNARTGKLIANIPFSVKVVDGSGKEYTWTNDDKDGIIYKSGLTAGTYTVSLIALEGELYENYDFSASGTVTVRDTIAYEKVDVSAEIKDETEINVASEEAQVEQVVESVNTDTVEWVESTKTLSTEEYTVIDKSLIAVPTASSVARSFLATASVNTASGSETADSALTAEETTAEVSYSEFTLSASPSDISLTNGGSTTLTVTATGATEGEELNYEFSSGNTSVATVAGNGSSATVTAAGTGTTAITVRVSYKNNETVLKETSVNVTVSQSYSDISVSLNQSSLSLTTGNTATLTATASGTSGEVLLYEFSSSDNSVVTVNDSGSSTTLTGVAAGTATITAKVYYANNTSKYQTAACKVTVSQGYSDFSLSLSSSSLSLNKNGSGTVTVTPQNTTSGESITYTYKSDNSDVAEVYGSDNTVTVKAVGAGTATISVTACYTNNTSKTASATFTVTVTSSSTALKTTDGRAVYVLENGSYRAATYDDYYTDGMAFYVKSEAYVYTGWQTIDGNTYYYTASGNYVVGEQVIQGVKYTFSSTGVLQDGSGTLGIDVSSHNGSIDWTAVKNSGVSYAIIRCGYRGYGSGVLVEDSRFRSNIQGALSAGLKVGVYFYSQAVTTTEAVEEASMVLELISGYSISMPVYIDVEYSNSSHDGRADSLGVSDRTAIVKAFCQTIQNNGYTAGIYANKTWLTSYLDMSQLSSYKVWLAQYASSPTYSGSYHMWQYTSSGSISGISGNVDLNVWYY